MVVPPMGGKPMGGEWTFVMPMFAMPTREALAGAGTGFAVPPWA